MNSSQKKVTDKSSETEPQVLSSVQTLSDMDPVAVLMPQLETQTKLGGQKDELVKMPETETLLKCEAATEFNATMAKCEAPTSCKITPALEHNLAGHLFEDGRHQQGTVLNEKFEHVGGFSVLMRQVPLYKQIWLKYGHIATSQVLMDSYSGQVSVVTDIMNSVLNMKQQRVSELSK